MSAQIKARSGDKVAHIVEGCTDTFERKKPDWRKRKKGYSEHLDNADPRTCLVSVVDELHNARSILHDLRHVRVKFFARFSATQEQTGRYYGSHARVVHHRPAGEDAEALANALRLAIKEIGEHKAARNSAQGSRSG